MQQILHPAIQLSLAAVALVAAITDFRSRLIPNWLIVVGLVAGLSLNVVFGGWQGLLASVLGFGLALLIYVPLFILRAMGGGDVKLMAAIGCMVGPQNWFQVFLLASLVGGIYAVCLLTFRNAAGGAFWNIWHIIKELVQLRLPFKSKPELDIGHEKALSVPHAVSIAVGAILFLYLQRS